MRPATAAAAGLTGPLAYTSQGGIEETDFLILAAVAFALSSDYGVFLLARISESRAPGVSEREAIAAGMQRTGRLVTFASILLASDEHHSRRFPAPIQAS